MINVSEYLDNLAEQMSIQIKSGKKVNRVHEIVNVYLKIRGWDKFTKEEYKKRNINYGRLASEAKLLLESCNDRLDDAIWSIDKMNYKANKGSFDWTIRTCLKYKKLNE
jgi:hypothetical protein